MKNLETERLRIRQLEEADAEFLLRLYNTDSFLQYIGDRNIRSLEGAREFLREGPIKMYKEEGIGMCLVQRKDDNTALGICGLVKRETLDDIDIGYGFLPEHYGQGYAFESSAAVFDYARTELRLKRLVGITQADNAGSIRILEKLGLSFEKNIEEPENAPAVELYAVNF